VTCHQPAALALSGGVIARLGSLHCIVLYLSGSDTAGIQGSVSTQKDAGRGDREGRSSRLVSPDFIKMYG